MLTQQITYTKIFTDIKITDDDDKNKARFIRLTIFRPENDFYVPYLICRHTGFSWDEEAPKSYYVDNTFGDAAIIRKVIKQIDEYVFPELEAKNEKT